MEMASNTSQPVESDFEHFRTSCLQWIDRLGLADWQISIVEQAIRDESYTQAEANWSWAARNAQIVYNTTYSQGPDGCGPISIEDLALHEVLHIALAGTVMSAHLFGPSSDATKAEGHALIHRLMAVLTTAPPPAQEGGVA